ncbi:MAG: cytochrome c [Spongiibacteraceae bacterium]|jgi:mono/diheme cytochrome c family protein|nr:cytochrome c [Spongiibacteraceae bacterium]
MKYVLPVTLLSLLTFNVSLAEPVSGERLYTDKCAICHAAGELGTMALSRRLGNERAILNERTDLPAEYVRHVVRHGLNAMPPITRGDVTDQELDLIVEFLTAPH